MKKIFFLLITINFLFAAIQIFSPVSRDYADTHPPGINPEKIIILPHVMPCIYWGYFSASNAESAAAAINQLNPSIRHRHVTSTPKTQYRLHSAAFKNQQAAEREINKFRNMGIMSYRVLEPDSWLNAITFGEFTDLDSAHKLQQKLNNSGISDTQINQYTIEQKTFLFFDTDTQTIAKLQTLVQQFPGSKLTHKNCERLL